MSTDKKYIDVCPHGPLEKVADDVYVVMGSFQLMPLTRIGLTMTIVKRGDDLTIINSMRVSPEVEEEIKKLGTIKNVVRITANHGASDPYYLDTFKATYYDLPGADVEGATKVPKADKYLGEADFPVKDSKVLLIKNIKYPEAVVFLPDDGGTLITADFIQNGRPAPHKSFMGKAIGKVFGFNTGCCNPPPLFFKVNGDGKDIYQPNVPAVLELEFNNIISGHGPPKMGGAKEDLTAGFAKVKEGPLWQPTKE